VVYCVEILSQQDKTVIALLSVGGIDPVHDRQRGISELCLLAIWLVACLVLWVVFLSIFMVYQIWGSIKRNCRNCYSNDR